MKKYLSRLSLPAYLIPLAAVLAVIGLIVAIVSCTGEGFGMASLPWVAVLTIAAVLLCGGILYFSATKGDRALPSLGLLLMVLAVSGCIYLMVYGKADVFGTVRTGASSVNPYNSSVSESTTESQYISFGLTWRLGRTEMESRQTTGKKSSRRKTGR